LFNDLFDCRQESDYEDFFQVDPELPSRWLLQVEIFIEQMCSMALPKDS